MDSFSRNFSQGLAGKAAKVPDMLAKGLLPERADLIAYIDACAPVFPAHASALPSGKARFAFEGLAGLPPAPALTEAEVLQEALFAQARETTLARFGNAVYVRGLIEFTNICRRDCFYCGIRHSNTKAVRYRMTPSEVLECCDAGYGLGFRTFVLQGGEDLYFTDEVLEALLGDIKHAWPDCAVTLSVGERTAASYSRLRKAGADRFLLRHESANADHFARLHPPSQSFAARRQALLDLKKAGYQVGAGLMVGSPWQQTGHLADDLAFMHALQPEMVGIGPFLPHQDTPFAAFPPGDVKRTLVMLALTRLMLPSCLLPATTALGSATGDGRERGILAGANVLMPNLSPRSNRKKYMLYDGKISDGDEAAENSDALKRRINAIGYQIVVARGDFGEEGKG